MDQAQGGDSSSGDEGFVDDSNVEEGMDMVHVLHEDDIDEVIDLGDELNVPEAEDEVVEGMGDMDLENYDDEGAVEGAGGGGEVEPLEPVVIVRERDDSQCTFDKHKGSVFCVSIDPATEKLAVTGGEDDQGFVWKVETGDVLFQCTGHKDSVTCASFNKDSTYVASGDMSGLLKVWKVDSGQEIWSFEVGDLEWLEWHPVAPVLLAGTADGATWMWKIPSGDCKTFQGHGCTCTVGRFMPDGKRACAGYGDGVIKVWDLKSGSHVQTFTGHFAHSASVTSLACHSDNNLVVSGSTDVTAKVYNTQSGKVISTYDCSESTKKENSVEAVGFSSTQAVVATGTLAGNLILWDLATQKQRHKCQHSAGIVRLKWCPSSPVIYTCCLDGTCNMWDSRTGALERQWQGHAAELLDMDVGNTIIASASNDSTARVYSLNKPGS